jgi:hypothetical protein
VKTLILAGIVLFWFAGASSPGADSASTEGDVGRFQIVSGTIQILSEQGKVVGTEHAPVMIKIDTKTGDTWILVTQFDNQSSGQGWMGIGDYFSSRIPKPKSK